MGSHLKLGLFGSNIDGGLSATIAPDRYRLSWDACVQVAQLADAAGFEFNVPLSRWTPLTPTSNYCGNSYETVTWAAGLAAVTRRIQIYATIHAPVVHPALAAKQIATLDHISGGRAGVNVVLGAGDLSLFDHVDPPQAQKYGAAVDWITRLDALWAHPERDGASPKPLRAPRPPIMNAGMSEESEAFAAQFADVALRRIRPRDYDASAAEFRRIKQAAAAHGRAVEIVTPCFILCRPSRDEAQRRFEAVFSGMADAEYTARLDTTGLTADQVRRMHVGYGHEALVGSPEDVAEGLERIAALGVDGVAVFFLDYLTELPHFIAEVTPALARRGLRAATLESQT